MIYDLCDIYACPIFLIHKLNVLAETAASSDIL